MKMDRLGGKAVAAAVIGVAAIAASGSVMARSNVYFNVGVQAAPGVMLGIGNAPVVYAQPAYYAPPPVYYAPAPVYYAPAPGSYAPGYYARPAPVYYAPRYYARPAPVYYAPRGVYRHVHRHPIARPVHRVRY